jgi:hypothetical protein
MAVKMYEKGDPSWEDWMRLAAKTSSTVGGGLSMLPFGVTQVVGGALQVPDLAVQGYDYAKELKERGKNMTREDVNRMSTNVDPMGNPLGY